MEVPILFEDGTLLVCQKPAGVLSENGGMPELLQAQCSARQIFCVHRLDKAVSGLMVYAKDGKTAAKLSESISSGLLTKEYLAVVQGVPAEKAGEMRDLLYHDKARNKTYVVKSARRGVKEAVLHYTLLQTVQSEFGPLSLLRVRLGTGRSHQIRVQFASRKLPLAGDGRYGSGIRGCGIALCAQHLAFPHPKTGELIDCAIEKPDGWPWSLFA